MPFRAPIKVCFGDIDNAGIVYYPRFMHYFHLAIEEFFATQLGIDFSDVLHKRKVSLPTVHVESDFHRRLEYGDRALGGYPRMRNFFQDQGRRKYKHRNTFKYFEDYDLSLT